MLEKLFHLKENHTNVKTEVMAGLTSFFTMAYIIFVNPQILSASGMDAGAVMLATCVSAAIGTFLMAFLANYPFALAPGMGLNAFLPIQSAALWVIPGRPHWLRYLPPAVFLC